MPYEEDPNHLSKSRLKSDLIAHNVGLPPAASKKEVYLELHLKHIGQKNPADFSSDEEETVEIVDKKGANPQVAQVPDSTSLTDDLLRVTLLNLGVKVGPIVASTRAVYERKLDKLLKSGEHIESNGAQQAVVYSDSEEDEVEILEDMKDKAGPELEVQETVEKPELIQQENNEAQLGFQRVGVAYSQCFLPSSKLRACSSKNGARSPKRNSKNALKSPNQTQIQNSQIPAGISRTSSIGQRSGLRPPFVSPSQSVATKSHSPVSPHAFSITKMVEEMESRSLLSPCSDYELNESNTLEHRPRSNKLEKQIVTNQTLFYSPGDTHQDEKMKLSSEPTEGVVKDFIPGKPTRTGIYVTARRPIKGAAQRPIQYAYPEIPVSPRTFERQEVECRLVPFYIQILVFLMVAFILCLIYVHIEDSSSVLTLLDSFYMWFFSEETQDIKAISGQE